MIPQPPSSRICYSPFTTTLTSESLPPREYLQSRCALASAPTEMAAARGAEQSIGRRAGKPRRSCTLCVQPASIQSPQKHPILPDPCLHPEQPPTAPALGPAAALGQDLDCAASVEPLGPLFRMEAGEEDDRLDITPGPAPCQAGLRFDCGEGTQEIAQRHSLALNYGLVTL